MPKDRLTAVVAGVCLLTCAGSGEKMPDFVKKEKAPSFRFAPITRSDVVRTVEATGTVTPRNSPNGIPVGAQVNGKIIKLFVDYNSTVTNGQIVALIDPQVYDATYRSSVAQLHVNEARVKQIQATLTLAEKTLARRQALRAKEMCSEADLDEAVEARDSARAQLESAKASVEQSKASVSQAKANLDYCTIRSPVNGVVIARKVEEGETVVSSMNAVPVLTIAEDLRTIWVEATVPEADVGNIKVGQTVTFTADAYRRKFTGRVRQIRMAATTTNNVVTYPIIIEAENPNEMLFPGMTATLSIETARAENVLVVSAAAFRFRPRKEHLPAREVKPGRKIWFADENGALDYHLVTEGVSDDAFTQILNADALEGRQAVIGYETVQTARRLGGETTNPFMPKHTRPTAKGTAPEPKKK
jgi:HlyD family secretion protein